MTKPLALGTLVGGLAVFVWGAVDHMALPFTNEAMGSFSNEEAVGWALAGLALARVVPR